MDRVIKANYFSEKRKARQRESEECEPLRLFRFAIFTLALFGLIFVRDVMSINIPNIVFLLLSALSYACFNYEESVAYTLMMIPLGCALAVNYTIGIGLIFMGIKWYIRINRYWVPFLLLLIYDLFHFIIPPFVFADYLRWAICMIMLMQIVYNKRRFYHVAFILKSFVYATLFILTDIFVLTARLSGGIGIFLNGDFRFGTINLFFDTETDVTSSLNQNTVGQLAIVCVALLLLLLYVKQISIPWMVVLTSVLVGYGFLCMSRTFVVCLALVVVSFVFFATKRPAQLFKNIMLVIVLGVLFVVIMEQIFPNTINSVLARFEEEDPTSERGDIFQDYNDFMFETPDRVLFGIGNLDKSAKTHIHSPHNATQEVFVSWGVFGIIIMYFILRNMKMVYNIRQNWEKPLRMGWLPFIPFLVSVQAGQLFSKNERMMYFALCFIALQLRPMLEKESSGKKKKETQLL